MSDLQFFLTLETRVWGALVTGDSETDQAMLSPDFLGVYSTGFSGRSDHVGQLANGPTVLEYRITQARIVALGQGRTLLAYRADFTRSNSKESEAMYVSSIWEQFGGEWRNTFSQDSNASDPAPV